MKHFLALLLLTALAVASESPADEAAPDPAEACLEEQEPRGIQDEVLGGEMEELFKALQNMEPFLEHYLSPNREELEPELEPEKKEAKRPDPMEDMFGMLGDIAPLFDSLMAKTKSKSDEKKAAEMDDSLGALFKTIGNMDPFLDVFFKTVKEAQERDEKKKAVQIEEEQPSEDDSQSKDAAKKEPSAAPSASGMIKLFKAFQKLKPLLKPLLADSDNSGNFVSYMNDMKQLVTKYGDDIQSLYAQFSDVFDLKPKEA